MGEQCLPGIVEFEKPISEHWPGDSCAQQNRRMGSRDSPLTTNAVLCYVTPESRSYRAFTIMEESGVGLVYFRPENNVGCKQTQSQRHTLLHLLPQKPT